MHPGGQRSSVWVSRHRITPEHCLRLGCEDCWDYWVTERISIKLSCSCSWEPGGLVDVIVGASRDGVPEGAFALGTAVASWCVSHAEEAEETKRCRAAAGL